MITIYGIKNCDKVRKTCKHFKKSNAKYQFHDWRQDGVDKKLIKDWLDEHEWQTLINQRGTTWRGLSEQEKQINGNKQAVELIYEYPTILKRPIICFNKKIFVGYDENHITSLIEKVV